MINYCCCDGIVYFSQILSSKKFDEDLKLDPVIRTPEALTTTLDTDCVAEGYHL